MIINNKKKRKQKSSQKNIDAMFHFLNKWFKALYSKQLSGSKTETETENATRAHATLSGINPTHIDYDYELVDVVDATMTTTYRINTFIHKCRCYTSWYAMRLLKGVWCAIENTPDLPPLRGCFD